MGMAASQVRFLSLQNRKNTIGLNLMTLSNRKTALSRDMSRVANEYNNAMNQKVLKWSNDSGVTYSDLTYDKLMKPNELNTTKPYIITDAQGRVVLDDNVIELEDGVNSKVTYRDLAMMISSYSGHNDDGDATYNDVVNLTGGTGITANAIENITDKNSIADKATSGAANTKKEYEIVTDSVQTVSNSLRYELMEKLGLITSVEKQEILNKEMEIYGSNDSTEGPYPIGTLMGDYFLALANYEAYQNLLKDGEYNFSTGSNTPASTKKTSNPSLGDKSEINYENIINGTGTTINFNGVSASSLGKVALEKVYNPDTDSVEDLKTKTGDITNNFSYTITNGQISYSYGTSTFLDMMGTCDAVGNGNYDKFNKDEVLLVNGSKIKGQNWSKMYKDNQNIDLYNSHRSRGGGGSHSYNQRVANDNLTILVNEMSNDFKNIDSVQIDAAAVEKARQSTIAFFMGDITNGGNSVNKNYGSNNGSDKIRNYANDKANNYNLIGSANRNGGWVQGTDDYIVATVNFKNLYNTFITFYDYYKHQPNVDAITSGATYEIPSTQGDYEPVDTTGVTYSDKKVFTDPTTKTQYVRLKGSIKGDDGKDHEFYDYYLTDASGNKTGDLIQRDALNPETNKWEREFYDPANKGANSKKYVIEKDKYDNYKETINQGTNGEALDTATTEVKAKDNNLELKYKDENGNEVAYVLHNEVGKSTYATSTTANPVNILETLQKKVDETAAAKDEALKEVDTLFAEKDSKIMDYFDALFKMISKNGWVYDENVNNTNKKDESKNYLNAKLQNNMYFITEVDTLDGKDYNYATKLATNVSKVFQVYDTDAQNQALSKYESEKADINSKEKQIDIRMNKLETEQDAIKTELDSIQSIIKDNVDTTFKIFT